MARKAKKKVAKKKVVSQPRKASSRPVGALLFFTIAALVAVSVFDYNTEQYNATNPTDPNLVGYFGSYVGFFGFHFLGVAVFLVPLFLIWFSVRMLLQQEHGKRRLTAIVSPIAVCCASGLMAMMRPMAAVDGSLFESQLSNGFGGVVGEFLGPVALEPYLGPFGAFLILFMGLVIGSILVFTDNFGRFLDYLQNAYREFLEQRAESKSARQARKAEILEAKRLAKQEAALAKAQAKEERANAKKDKESKAAKKSKAVPKEVEVPTEDEAEDFPDDGRRPSLLSGAPTPLPVANVGSKGRESSVVASAPAPKKSIPPKAPESKLEPELKKPALDPATIKIISGEKTEKAVASIPERRGDYVFPPLNLLSEAPDVSSIAPEDHAGTMNALVRTLEEFSVKVIPGEIHTGPVITRYEVTPAPGVRVEKIVNLDKNIALGLKAMSVRILAPVPGKGTVGIEVPNKISLAVCMRDIVESKAWAEANAEIPIVLGKDVTGKPMVTDLTKMPHVLIAGSTGSGKTVCINAIIASLLYHSGPEDLRFIMVDPKVVEMQMYNALPHMLIPVVTEAKKVPGALKWLIAEMEHRYQIFAKTNVRNIAGFNAKIAKDKEEQAKAEAMDAEMSPEERAALQSMEVPRDDDAFEIPRKKLPYIVCVIDELADLMMVAPADIETCIARIAQLARAAGIHLILATQRPSVNVITGVIKANLPSRISFKVASKIDSRTILDGGGAEALIGKGDMLFIPPGTSNLVRAQGAFVSDDEINAIVDFLKEKNDPPQFAEDVQKQIDAGGDDAGSSDDGGPTDGDELLPDAIDVLRSTKRASTSMLQRRLRIGYNRAARLMEELEERGIVGPENGSSPREIMVDLDAM
ncbi:DNA translocase FtsK [Coraliomargarita sp. SDUM461004]|uniref:DNA translocase FtsK n=1 Tax=Thalassobacterium sedimentorum TaxID=3041258 RepID=A0ABU1AHQ7_9BACT|nr:DNA translocase FtsK [Coraliomargarita sp. SDUM461004]MDQ8194310.1 DNA translocase FtsK [Coraliomargarita sp. SDUM461004]